MIQKLTYKNQQQVLDFCYKRERENLFVIGSFKNYEKPFSVNKYYGYFNDNELVGLAVFFSRFKNFVINADNEKFVEELLDYGMEEKLKIECIAAFKKYAQVMVDRLTKVYKIKPKKFSEESVYTLDKNDFNDFSTGAAINANKKDIDEIVWFNTGKSGKEIDEEERRKIFSRNEFILRVDGKIASKANVHGVSRNYFQIGGVGTKKEHRKKGYAKQVVSSLCKHFFDKGLKHGLLFTGNDNIPAQKVYKSIGFKPVDEFIIAGY